MTDERTFELVSAAADGELNDVEQAELDRLLEQSPEVRRFHADLGRVNSIMRKVPELTPPETLHDRIMTATSLPAARTHKAAPGTRFGRPGWPAPSAVLRYGLATAAGLVLAVGFYESQSEFNDRGDIMELVGTMAPNHDRTAAGILDSYSFRTGGLESQIFLERRNGALLLDIQVDADKPIDISVDLAAAGARLDALAQTGSSFESIEISGQTLRVRALGRRQLTALLHRVDDAALTGRETIELQFSSEGKLLQRGSLIPAW
jgi:hypothetical protein